MELLILVLNMANNKVFKIIRSVIGNIMSGNVTHPLSYYGTSLSQTIREIHAVFPTSLVGQSAIFMINTNQSEIASIPEGSKSEIEQSANWIFYASALITTGGDCKTQIDISQIGSLAIAAYCPVTTIGSQITISM